MAEPFNIFVKGFFVYTDYSFSLVNYYSLLNSFLSLPER